MTPTNIAARIVVAPRSTSLNRQQLTSLVEGALRHHHAGQALTERAS